MVNQPHQLFGYELAQSRGIPLDHSGLALPMKKLAGA